MLKFRSKIDSARVLLRDLFQPPLSADPLPTISPDVARGVVLSIYMPNVSRRVVAAQRRLLKRFAPPDVTIVQMRTTERHEDALTKFVRTTPYRAILVLDIDCVPVASGAIEHLLDLAGAGYLAGTVSRANHIENGRHLFVAPFCLAISTDTYRAIGSPDLESTFRGDVAEELTYRAEEKGVPLKFLWPISSDDDVWELVEGRRYGHGTTYEAGFWHAFQIRFPRHQDQFVQRCDAFLRAAE